MPRTNGLYELPSGSLPQSHPYDVGRGRSGYRGNGRGSRGAAGREFRARFPNSTLRLPPKPLSGTSALVDEPFKNGTGGKDKGLDNAEPVLETADEREQFWLELAKAREVERQTAIAEGKMDDPNIPKRLEDAICIVGTCMDMCPRFERYRRERENNLFEWEIISGTKRVDHERAVKMYERAAGDKTLPSDLRPPQVLKRTLDYLFGDLLPRGGFSETFNFIRDRSRAVRSDFTIQHDTGPIAIESHDRCVRFHILALHFGRKRESFSIALEEQLLMNTLQSLKEFYEDQRSKYESPTELEMRVYHRLVHIRDQKERHDDIPEHILSHPVFMLTTDFRLLIQQKSAPITKTSRLLVDAEAMEIFGKLANVLREQGNIVMIYLVACILERHFGTDAIENIEDIRGSLSIPDIINGNIPSSTSPEEGYEEFNVLENGLEMEEDNFVIPEPLPPNNPEDSFPKPLALGQPQVAATSSGKQASAFSTIMATPNVFTTPSPFGAPTFPSAFPLPSTTPISFPQSGPPPPLETPSSVTKPAEPVDKLAVPLSQPGSSSGFKVAIANENAQLPSPGVPVTTLSTSPFKTPQVIDECSKFQGVSSSFRPPSPPTAPTRKKSKSPPTLPRIDTNLTNTIRPHSSNLTYSPREPPPLKRPAPISLPPTPTPNVVPGPTTTPATPLLFKKPSPQSTPRTGTLKTPSILPGIEIKNWPNTEPSKLIATSTLKESRKRSGPEPPQLTGFPACGSSAHISVQVQADVNPINRKPLRARARRRVSSIYDRPKTDEELARRFKENREEHERRWACGTFLKVVNNQFASRLLNHNPNPTNENTLGNITVQPQPHPRCKWTLWLSLNTESDPTAIWLERKFDIPASGTWVSDVIFSIPMGFRQLRPKPKDSSAPAESELMELELESDLDSPGLVIFERTPLEGVVDEIERKYRILDDCARLRDLVKAFPLKRHFIPCLLIFSWMKTEEGRNVNVPTDFDDMVRRLVNDKTILDSHVFLVTSEANFDFDAKFPESLKALSLDLEGKLVRSLSIAGAFRLFEPSFVTFVSEWIDNCFINGQFAWDLFGRLVQSTSELLNGVISSVSALIGRDVPALLPTFAGENVSDNTSAYETVTTWLSDSKLPGPLDDIFVNINSHRAVGQEFPTCSFFRHLWQLILNQVELRLTPVSNCPSEPHPKFYINNESLSASLEAHRLAYQPHQKRLGQFVHCIVRRSPRRRSLSAEAEDSSSSQLKRPRLSSPVESIADVPELDISMEDGQLTPYINGRSSYSPSPTVSSSVPASEGSGTNSYVMTAAMLRSLARDFKKKYGSS